MKKKRIILCLLIISILFISIGSVNASWFSDVWNEITGKVVGENITEPEPEPEPEPESQCEDSDGGIDYYVRGILEISCTPGDPCQLNLCESVPAPGDPVPTCLPPSDWCSDEFVLNEGYCEDGNILFEGYDCPEGCEDGVCLESSPPQEEECEEGETENHICEDGTEVPESVCEEGIWVPIISPENDCPEEEPETCAAKIEINFDKTSYVVGEEFGIKIAVFDSQENPISDYPFYVKMYDNRWHTPDLQRTSSDGWFRSSGIAEELPNEITKVEFNVYTKEMEICESVEDITNLEIRQAPEPCEFGNCVPEPECKNKIKKCGGDCPPCSDKNDTGIFYPCRGCDVDDKCYPMGYRKGGTYCSEDYDFVNQSGDNINCENSFECKTNLCINENCVSSNVWNKFLVWFKKLVGDEEDEEKPKSEVDCSKLLIEKNIGDYKYLKSGYGEDEHTRVPIFSENGNNIGTMKCCAAEYIPKEKNKEVKDEDKKVAIICPYDNREELRTSLIWILAKEAVLNAIEYKGEKVLGDENVIVWTNNAYLIASGGDPRSGTSVAGDIADAYFEKYPSDFDLTEDDIPYIEPKPFVFCTEEDKKAAKECMNGGGYMQSDPSALDGTEEGKKSCIESKGFGEGCCEVYTGCSSDSSEDYDPKKEFLIKAEIVGELTLIDFETLPDGTVLQNGDRLTGNEWESLGVVFEFPSEDYLQVFGPKYPFNSLDKLSLSPGLGPFEAGGDTHDDLNIIFSEPVKAAGIYLLDLGETDERESIIFLDKNGNSIEEISPWPKSTFGNPAPGTFISLIHEEGISKIEILENTQDSDDIAYDNLYFVK